jgi:hypothetical protein
MVWVIVEVATEGFDEAVNRIVSKQRESQIQTS